MKNIPLILLLFLCQIGIANISFPSDTLKTPEQKEIDKKKNRLNNRSSFAGYGTASSSSMSAEQRQADKDFVKLGYSEAADAYEALAANQKNATVQARIAESYRMNADYATSEHWYSQMIGNSTKAEDFLRYAQVLLANGKCEMSEKMYQKYADMVPMENRIKMASCNDLMTFATSNVEVTNMNDLNGSLSEFSAIPYGEGIYFTSNRRKERASLRKDKWTKKGFTDLFYAEMNHSGEITNIISAGETVNGKWHDGTATFGEMGDFMVFTKNNPKPNSMNDIRNLDLYTSSMKNGEWKKAEKMMLNVDDYSTCHPTLSMNQNELYFASDRPGGMGGMDIWMSSFVGGKWQAPVNLGPKVNSKGNETFPHIAKDGTLYISSDGHPGMGGIDIFSCTMMTNKGKAIWATPVNMGTPFNTSKDDFSFYVKNDNKSGWLSSNREGGKGGDDIYKWNGEMPNAMPAMVMRPVCLFDEATGKRIAGGKVNVTTTSNYSAPGTVPNGAVVNRDCGDMVLSLKPMSSNPNEFVLSLENKGNTTNTMSNVTSPGFFTTDKEGLFSYPVMQGATYSFAVNHPGYQAAKQSATAMDLMSDDNYCIAVKKVKAPTPKPTPRPVPKPAPKPVPKVIKPAPVVGNTSTGNHRDVFRNGVDVPKLNRYFLGSENATFRRGMIIKLSNLYYDFNKATIRSDASVELDYVYELLKTYPSLKIALLSHTDSRGTSTYNQNLSAGRASEAMTYLIRKGISASRLSARGMGENSPVNDCVDGVNCEEYEHQLNRRTEIQVVDFNEQDVQIRR